MPLQTLVWLRRPRCPRDPVRAGAAPDVDADRPDARPRALPAGRREPRRAARRPSWTRWSASSTTRAARRLDPAGAPRARSPRPRARSRTSRSRRARSPRRRRSSPRPSSLTTELDRAARAADMAEHGLNALSTGTRGRDLEAQTSLKRGALNLRHAREAIARLAREVEALRPMDIATPMAPGAAPVAGLAPYQGPGGGRRRGAVRTPHVVVSSSHTTRDSGGGRTEGRCAAPSAAPATRGSWTPATSTRRRRSGAAASAPPAAPGSPPTSGSRPPAWSSPSATAPARSSTATSSRRGSPRP